MGASVDVIVVQAGRNDLTIQLLRSLPSRVRPILATNGGLIGADVMDEIQRFQNSHSWYSFANMGYTWAVNRSLELPTRAPFVLLVNNDVVMSEGSVEALTAYLDNHPQVGAVSARHQTASPSPEVLSFACVMLRREAIDQVGPLDESFEYGVDDDYSIRLKAAGWQIAVADVHVHHEGAATWKAVKGDDWIKQDSEEALRRLAAKHG